MSVYSSDPFVWEKEQAGRAGPESAWFLEPDLYGSVCGSIRLSLSVSTGRCVDTQQAPASSPLELPPPQSQKEGCKYIPSLEYTSVGLS